MCKISSLYLFSLILFTALAVAQTTLTLETNLLVPASPLQAYRAFTVDWQLKEWLAARDVTMIPEPGGIWRVTDQSGNLLEGIVRVAEPGSRFEYTLVATDTQQVEIAITPLTDGSRVQITHRADQHAITKPELEHFWAVRLPGLRNYLSGYPASYRASPSGADPHPAVVILHDKFGVNRTVRSLCDSLAAAGYIAIAVDLFKGEQVSSVEQADRFAAIADPAESAASAERVLNYLRADEHVQKNRLALWGIGYGGTIAYDLATRDAKLRGVVTWYASTLPAVEKRESLSGPILAIFGDADNQHPRPEIESFDQSLVQAGIRAETVIVSGGSTFAEPQYGADYNAAATQEAWRQTLNFLDRRLKF